MALEDYGLLALRIALGIIFIYHSWPKIKNPNMMKQVFGNSILPVILGLFELIAGLLILIGLVIQFASIILIIVMLGALYYKIIKWKIPFASQNSSGWEFDLLILAAAILLLFIGAGSLSIDNTLLP